ncbi:MAG: SPOR domain-containing protein [Pseudomonadota bacterium]|nr:SPOR domain-containing protein [Pseudomonadota bacterium]
MARHAEERSGPRWLRTILIGLVVVCGLGAAAIIIPPMMFEQDVDVALIKAEQGPFKIKPKDPGGATIPHQETMVMGMIGGLVESSEEVEILRPPSAVPEMPPTPDDGVQPQAAPEPVAPKGSAGTEPAEETEPKADGTPAPATWGPEQTSPAAETASADAVDNATGSDNMADADTTVAIARPTSKPKPPKRVRVEGEDPLYLVQLAAFREVATAREQAGLLNSKHRARLDGAELGTMKSDSGDDGIFWRVVTEPLPRAEADRICAALKRAGQDCILRKFDAAAG